MLSAQGSLNTCRPGLNLMETYRDHPDIYGWGAGGAVAAVGERLGLMTEDCVRRFAPTKPEARNLAWTLLVSRVHTNPEHGGATIEGVDRIDRLGLESLYRLICKMLLIGAPPVEDPFSAIVERGRIEAMQHLKRAREPESGSSDDAPKPESPVAKRIKLAGQEASPHLA